ncbi:MAG: fibrillarin-like rRNA/tRNA 2'-O-methyltransferase [Candidatus Heimdallarchaeota archaeon]|nr:MAG: fibrillarin-like rRNA/tRNA 2'-O-methyltransferase [Candidatus Heimdallarchaeota archaeon]
MELAKTNIEGLFQVKVNDKSRLVTHNKVPGKSVYGEMLLSISGEEYRVWDPYRSKFAAAFLSGMKELPQIQDKRILYLGVSTGTTASHFSDILVNGVIFGIEFSPKVMRRFFRLAEQRDNLIPILADARRPEEYSPFVFEVDMIYQDVAQPEQATIFGRNSQEFLRSGGYGFLAVKSQSIDVVLKPGEVFSKQMEVLEQEFGLEIQEFGSIDAFEKKHAVIIVKKP